MKKSRIILVILAVLFLVLVGLAIGKPMTMFMSEPEKFQMWVESKGIWGILAFIGMNAAQVLFAVIPGGPFEIGAGYAFGIWKGSLICDIAMPFAYNIGFHDATWRDRFGKNFYLENGSHGCINVALSDMEKFYANITVDTAVIAYYRTPVRLSSKNANICNAFSKAAVEED